MQPLRLVELALLALVVAAAPVPPEASFKLSAPDRPLSVDVFLDDGQALLVLATDSTRRQYDDLQ
jgi:hypothetical protein